MARISDDERVRRLHEIDILNQEGLTDHAISEKLGLPITTIKRLQAYLKGLMQADLTPEVLAKKRSELFLELSSATEEAKKLFDKHKVPKQCMYCKGTGVIKSKTGDTVCNRCKGYGEIFKTTDAERFLKAWVDVIEKKAKLYGLDNIKTDINFNQFNDRRQYVQETKLTGNAKTVSQRLAQILKNEHESRMHKLNEADEI